MQVVVSCTCHSGLSVFISSSYLYNENALTLHFDFQNGGGIDANRRTNGEEFNEFTSYRSSGLAGGRLQLTQSRTLDSLNEVAATKVGTPSTVSR